jgi:hypothetical protein
MLDGGEVNVKDIEKRQETNWRLVESMLWYIR